jgi:1-phosphatidylinositol phosphodiesterase
MAPPLTIRNLTTTPITLKIIERYNAATGAAVTAESAVKAASRFVTNFTATAGIRLPGSTPTNVTIAEGSESFAHEEVDIRLEALQFVNTDKSTSERDNKDILRLTFEVEDQRYRLDVPSPSNHSNELICLGPDPRFHFTAIFVPNDGFLAVFSSANLDSWQGELKDSSPLSALSIPGTHNSPTCNLAAPSVRCQAVTPREQLNNGVRFFDIRVQPEKPEEPGHDGLILVHGVFPISLTGNKYFRDLINEVHDFLSQHRSETVIVSLKREGPGEHTDQQLARKLRDHYANDDRWWTEPRVPRLGEARGKVVLLRRFALDDGLRGEHDGRGWGLDAENWAYNTPHDQHGDVIVQDFCEVLETENIEQKISVACEQLNRAGETRYDFGDGSPVPPLYLNFLSASNFWRVGCWPEKIAAKLNPAIITHLVVKHVIEHGDADWSTGIVVCDWVGDQGDWDLVRAIVGMNAKLKGRE